MTDSNSKEQALFTAPSPETDLTVEPSWKPLLWLVGILAALIGLGEILLELGFHLVDMLLEVLEVLYLALIEAPEEFLEDKIEQWLKAHFPHDADRYSEIVTATGLTPLKILLGFLLLRWLWRVAHGKLFPKIVGYFKRQYTAVRLAWHLLAWPFKLLIAVATLGGLFLFI